ncbi:MAG: ribose-phosphate pyrophosphokinase [Nitrospirota bacterium]
MTELKIFSGNSNRALAEEIVSHLNLPLGDATVATFSDGEVRVQINESVRGSDIYVIQSTSDPVNTNLMELLIMIDALKRASAKEITAVIPYYGYGRQDRKDQPRVPISAKLVADLIVTSGASRVLTLDLHTGQTQGFFNIPVDHLYAMPVLLGYFKTQSFHDLVVVSPDAGGVERARAFAKRLGVGLAIVDKRREGPNQTKVMNIIGEVKDRDVLILDDMIDTAGTLTQAAEAIAAHGSRRIVAACTHAIFSGPALDRVKSSPIEKIVVTNSVPLKGKENICDKIVVLSVANLLGDAIKKIHEGSSINSLFV